ncbi:MAG: tyrosine-type recombinase/integrase, partial [Erysipelotrichaceae bacterium]|nr:tyrosine-type recombinase/integrase [Erysipelotrichaceae bacterium]
RTYDSYDKQYDKYIKEYFADRDIKDITEEDILSTLTICSKNCSTHYVSKLKTLWKKLFIIAQRKRVLQMNLVDIIESPKSDKVTERSLNEQNITEDDFQAFCEAMSNYGHYLPEEKEKIYNRDIMLYLLKVMRITGMRSQEGRAVKRENIIFAGNEYIDAEGNATTEEIAYVCVRRSIGSTRDEYDVEINTKTPQSIRDIPVSGVGVNLLKEVLAYSKHDLLFAKYDGTPIGSDEFSDYLYRVSNSCGIKVYSLLMRKSFSADLYREGVNPAVTKRLMGHKKEDMSLNAYATTNKEELLKTARNRKFKK